MASEQQPRERPVPCQLCGIDPRTHKPRTMTWNLSAICDLHPERRKADRSTNP